jgi:hypothetical protein
MREYDEDDENIRLYAPVLQRVIILAAVIIAVPVMMWTITTFIRSYMERPKAPTFQHLTLTEPSQSSPPASPLSASVPPPQSATQPDSAPILADAARASSDGPGSYADANQGSLKAPLAPPVGDAGAGPGPSSAAATPVPPPNPSVAGSPAAPASPAGAAPRLAANASTGTPASPTDRGLAWPNANTGNAPSFGGSPPPATAETASAELPTAEPIKGHIPLPRHRPDLTMAAMGPSVAATGAATAAATGSIAPAGHVPLPRLRPADATADAPPAPSSPNRYQPGLDSGH